METKKTRTQQLREAGRTVRTKRPVQQGQPAICPHYIMLKVCAWRADVKCHAGPCRIMSDKQQAMR